MRSFKDFIVNLPEGVRTHLLSYLDVPTLLCCACVSKDWERLISLSSSVWRRACRRYDLIVRREELPSCAKYWKEYILLMNKRKQRLKFCECFDEIMYSTFPSEITAMYYHNGKLALGYRMTCSLWMLSEMRCVQSLSCNFVPSIIKFDNNYVVVAAHYPGIIQSWSMSSNHGMQFHKGVSLTDFDFLSHYGVLVSSYSNGGVTAWNLRTGVRLDEIVFDDSTAVKKICISVYSSGFNDDHQNSALIFLMRKNLISVFEIVMSSSSCLGGTVMSFVLNIYTPPYYSPIWISINAESLYIALNASTWSSEIWEWCFRTRCVVWRGKFTGIRLESHLAAGKRYMLCFCFRKEETFGKVILLDKEMHKQDCYLDVPRSLRTLCVGETSWLDGLNGENDRGLVFACVSSQNKPYLYNWITRKEQYLLFYS